MRESPELDNSAWLGGIGIAGVWRASRFDQEHMGLFLGQRTMLDPFGNNEQFARPDAYISVAQLHRNPTLQDEKEIVRISVLVPDEFALYLDDHQVMAVELADCAGLKVFGKQRELLSEIDWVHR